MLVEIWRRRGVSKDERVRRLIYWSFLLYLLAKPFPGEWSSCVCLYCWCCFHGNCSCTHTHAQSHCSDDMLLGNVFKTMAKCNWFSADSKVRGCWSCTRADLPPISPSVAACSCHLCSHWTCTLWIYSRTKWRGTKARASQHLVPSAKATKESKELSSPGGLSSLPLSEAF